MKKLLLLFLLSATSLVGQNWTQLNNIGTQIIGTTTYLPPKIDAISLTINNKIYIVGHNSDNLNTVNQIWEYNTTDDSWIFKSNYPGYGLNGVTAFAIGDIIYVGTGMYNSNKSSDFYAYDTQTNNWNQITNLPVEKAYASAFTAGGKGYVCCGMDYSGIENEKDLWEYDPISTNWTEKDSLPGMGRYVASSFTINEMGCIGLGYNNNNWLNDFYIYDHINNTWDTLPTFPGTGRCRAAAGSLNNKGYIIGGNYAMTAFSDCYEFDFLTNNWTQITSMNTVERTGAFCASDGNNIYAGGGEGALGSPIIPDWYRLESTTGLKNNDFISNNYNIYQNTQGELIISITDNQFLNKEYLIYNINGQIAAKGKIENTITRLSLNETGSFIVSINYINKMFTIR